MSLRLNKLEPPTIYHTQARTHDLSHSSSNPRSITLKLEPTIYHTQGEDVNHHTTDTVSEEDIRKSKDWLARNQDNVSEWGDMSIRGLLFQWTSTIQIELSVLV
jgi:hypothetical protein